MVGGGTNNAGNGICGTTTQSLITNNTIQNCQNYAINPYSYTYTTFSLNVFRNNVAGGVEVWNCKNCTWLQNTVTNNNGYGFLFVASPASTGNFFANNTVSSNTAGNWYGMSGSTNSTLQGNTGLTGYQTLNVTVSGNGSVSESCGTQTLSSISGDLWQFPTSSTIVLTAICPSSSFYNFTFTNRTVTTNNPLHLLMNNNFDVTANFSA
jgi:parallel beta-helix repeat protein